MPFVSVCKAADVQEGRMGWFRVQRKSVLIVWPRNGELKAYRGRCPHQDVPLDTATFDGEHVVCGVHQWRFDGSTGRCVGARPCALHPYPLRVQDDELQVDLG
ncbi:Rieske 2Fe-2S domain-containing protein [Sorangium sp. So ce1024]|uniref:Rieske 2Fe-2S domain-containing protein n=1 Tax=unclassified Sorangium TaxID=2621164 RepID=UPI003F07A0AD